VYQESKFHIELFQNQTFSRSVFSTFPFISKNTAVQRKSLEYMLPDILCKSKKEYQNIVGWFFVVLVWFFLSW